MASVPTLFDMTPFLVVTPFSGSTAVPTTPNLQLNVPPTGFPNWGNDVNQNFVILDDAVGALQQSYQGVWISTKTYGIGQIVTYNGLVYISLQSNNTNQPPDTNPDYWGPMGSTLGAPFPTAGIPVSTGSAGPWAASIPPASFAYVTIPNTFTKKTTMQGQLEVLVPDGSSAFWLGQPQAPNGKGLFITADSNNNRVNLQTLYQGIDNTSQTLALNPNGGRVSVNSSFSGIQPGFTPTGNGLVITSNLSATKGRLTSSLVMVESRATAGSAGTTCRRELRLIRPRFPT